MRYCKAIIILLICTAISCTTEQADSLYPVNDAQAQAFYTSTLKNVIDTKCISCHIYHVEGNNRYDNYEKTKSNIVQMVSRINSNSNTVMPPADATQLTEEEASYFQEFLDLLNADDDTPEPRVQIEWTAYKYPDYDNRAGVSGTFDTVTYTFNESGDTPVSILEDAIVTVDASSVNVGNESERTQNVFTFFAAFTPDILGTVTSFTDTTVTIDFEMNSITTTQVFDVTILSDRLVLTGSIPDLSIYNWDAGYDALEAVCGEYHENKLWEDVDVTINILLEE